MSSSAEACPATRSGGADGLDPEGVAGDPWTPHECDRTVLRLAPATGLEVHRWPVEDRLRSPRGAVGGTPRLCTTGSRLRPSAGSTVTYLRIHRVSSRRLGMPGRRGWGRGSRRS